MKNCRAFGLALSLMCLLAAPHTFAGSSDKDKDKDTKKVPTKQSTPQPKPQPAPTTPHPSGATTTSQPSGSHGSSAQSQSGGTHGSSTSSQPGGASSSTMPSHSQHGMTSTSGNVTTRSHGEREKTVTSNQVNRPFERPGHRVAPETRARLDHINRHPSELERVHSRDLSRQQIARFHGRVAGPLRFQSRDTVFLTHVRIVPTTYYYRRTAFYDAYGWQPPVYVYGFAPRYGVWDATFLAFALDHIAEDQYALMFYHHRNDAEFQQWMQDSDRLAAENDDLRAKVENMKLQMAKLDEQGVEADPSYVPPDAQDVALSPEVITALTASKN